MGSRRLNRPRRYKLAWSVLQIMDVDRMFLAKEADAPPNGWLYVWYFWLVMNLLLLVAEIIILCVYNTGACVELWSTVLVAVFTGVAVNALAASKRTAATFGVGLVMAIMLFVWAAHSECPRALVSVALVAAVAHTVLAGWVALAWYFRK